MATNQPQSSNYRDLVLAAIKNKYPYLLLGATVILILFLFFTGIFGKNKMYQSKTVQDNSTQNTPTTQVKKYSVVKGDTLWSIAEATYGSGFNYPDIVAANKLPNPSIIEVGQELILPNASSKQPTVGEVTTVSTSNTTSEVVLNSDSYTVKEGDYLWNIAVAAYGDGFAWVKIAQANNLDNPSIIHPGNVFKLPR